MFVLITRLAKTDELFRLMLRCEIVVVGFVTAVEACKSDCFC